MTKTLTVSALQALTGQVTRKLDEGVFLAPSGLTYKFRGLSDIELGWLRGKCYEPNGELNGELFFRWVVRAAWTGLAHDGEDYALDTEPVRFNGPTPNGSGMLTMVTWEMVEAVGLDLFPLALAIVQHAEQTPEERVRLGFTDGSCTTDSPAANLTASVAASAGAFESPSTTAPLSATSAPGEEGGN